VSDALAWLRARAPTPPAHLADRMAAALRQVATVDDVPRALGDAAFVCLEASLALGPGRAAALDLLAADALLTYAWEAAAESGAEGLERFAADCPPERFQALVPEAG
jgi:hypothetical protein